MVQRIRYTQTGGRRPGLCANARVESPTTQERPRGDPPERGDHLLEKLAAGLRGEEEAPERQLSEDAAEGPHVDGRGEGPGAEEDLGGTV